MTGKRRALADLSGYFVCSVITAAAAFLSIPLLTRLLGIEEFGRWLLLEPLQVVLSQVALLGVNYGIVKQITYDGSKPRSLFLRMTVASQPVLISGMVMCILILPRYGFSLFEASFFALLVELESIYVLQQAAFRASSCVSGFTAGTLAKASFLAILTVLFFAVGAGMTVEQVLVWRVITTGAGVLLGGVLLARHDYRSALPEKIVSTFAAYRNGVRYGAPILATGVLAMVIEFADRYILKGTFDYRTLACYLIYVKVAACLTPAITTPFSLWWATERFRRLADEDGGRAFFSRTALLVLVLYVVAGGTLWIISPALVQFFAPGVPHDGGVIIVLIASVIAMSMAAPLNIGLLNEGKTHINIIAAFAGASLNITLCLLLIRRFGPMGAAVATLASYAGYAGCLNYLSQRVYPVPFPYRSMAKVIVVAALAAGAAGLVPADDLMVGVAGKFVVFSAVLAAFIGPQIKGLATLALNGRASTGAA